MTRNDSAIDTENGEYEPENTPSTYSKPETERKQKGNRFHREMVHRDRDSDSDSVHTAIWE